jgi:hypothetical protein
VFAPDERQAAFEALAARLEDGGVLLSHCHDGAWTPPAAPFHATEALIRNSDWALLEGPTVAKPKSRSAWLVSSTG